VAWRSPWVEADFYRGKKEASLKKGIVFRKQWVKRAQTGWELVPCLGRYL
jgi:hypothetical protein